MWVGSTCGYSDGESPPSRKAVRGLESGRVTDLVNGDPAIWAHGACRPEALRPRLSFGCAFVINALRLRPRRDAGQSFVCDTAQNRIEMPEVRELCHAAKASGPACQATSYSGIGNSGTPATELA